MLQLASVVVDSITEPPQVWKVVLVCEQHDLHASIKHMRLTCTVIILAMLAKE